ncbi:cellulase, partial [Acidithiobacillus ferrivorans]|nr:cellulase [Acidithiobacillus ferrivorans]
ITTSEGQSYALFFALVANNPKLFQNILTWTQDNLAQGSLAAHLPAWRWGERPNKTWGVLDTNSAADADLWIAYTLIQAGRLWDRNSYTAMGTLLAKRIDQKEVVDLKGMGPMLIPGNAGFRIAPDT